MKNKNLINPIGLKGNEIHERQLALMGIKPLNENENKSNHAVELTKVGPDGNAYAIVRENHEYYIKKTTKTTGLVLEDFKYIGGLQNKKDESYPSYAKAIKQLNLKFKSLAESFNKGGDINVFEDDNLLEHHTGMKDNASLSATKGVGDNTEYIVDKAGTPLSNKAKEGKEEGQFGDNVADKDAADEFEKVNVSEAFGMGFTGEGNLHGNKAYMGDDMEMTEEEMAIQEIMDRMAEEEKEYSDKQKDLAALGGDPTKIDGEDFAKLRGGAELEEITMSSSQVHDSMSVNALEKVLDYYRDLYRNSNGNENIKNLMDDTEGKLRVLKTPTMSSVKSDVGPYGHNLEESIERLDTLLDGELKKKALK